MMPPHTLVTAVAQQGTCKAQAKWLLMSVPFLGCSPWTAHREKLARMGPSPPRTSPLERHQHPVQCLHSPWKVLR